jgi:3-hydroxyacyl-[acyl-carrier-protein] dehydratase
MLDKVGEIDEGKSSKGLMNLTYYEWFFPAHFGDNPNVLGVIMLEVLLEMSIMAFITLPERVSKESTDVRQKNYH